MIFSICAPVAVVESLHPAVRDRTWLGPVGLVVTAAGYLAASALVLQWTLRTEDFAASAGQLIGASAAVIALIVLGLLLGRPDRPAVPGRTPAPWLVGVGALIAATAFDFDKSWIGALVGSAVLIAAFVALARFSRTEGWSARHVLMVAGGALLARALQGFLIDPIGDGSDVAKYVHNSVAVLLVIVLVAIGWIRNRAQRDPLTSRQGTAPVRVT